MKDLGILCRDRQRGSAKYPARMMLAMSIMLWSTYEGRWRNVISLSRAVWTETDTTSCLNTFIEVIGMLSNG
jgi:hypothetical protein